MIYRMRMELINPMRICFYNLRSAFKMDELGVEIMQISIPAALALAADPIASLIDTAFIGHIGPVELAAVGVSIAVFNQVSRIAIFPLVSVTTSFVAEEDAAADHHLEQLPAPPNNCTAVKLKAEEEQRKKLHQTVELLNLPSLPPPNDVVSKTTACHNCQNSKPEEEQQEEEVNNKNKNNTNRKRRIPTVPSALFVGSILGILQTTILIAGAEPLLKIMGLNYDSPMMSPAKEYLTIRSLGSPAVLLSLAAQGVYRGLKDTKTPLYATVAGNSLNIALDPILIFTCRLGIKGAAIAHVVSQYLMLFILLWKLGFQVELLPKSLRDLHIRRFLKCGFLLLARVIAVTFCVTLSASLAAHQGSVSMAAFQICLQVWMTTSLLADGLAVAAQAILASSFAKGDLEKARAAASRVLQHGFVLGLFLSVALGIGLLYGGGIFTKDANVLRIMQIGIPFVAATQPINTIAFVFDGINYGASDFAYSAYSMIVVAIISIVCLILLSSAHGFLGLWIGLTIYMNLRMLAGFWRIGTATGPWGFLRTSLLPC